MAQTGNQVQTFVIRIIRFYQRWISAAFPPRCRFEPSCSSYFIEAIEHHGVTQGLWLGVRRLIKCHPFHSGGYDPVPTFRHLHNESLQKQTPHNKG